jgi:hypothetical protein
MSGFHGEDTIEYLAFAGGFRHQGRESQQGLGIVWIKAERLFEEIQRFGFLAALNGIHG